MTDTAPPPPAPPAPAPPAEQALELADRYWDALLELDPILATQVGDQRFDDRLPDTSEEGVARARAVHRAALDESRTIDRSVLGESERTALDVLEAIAHRNLEAIRMRTDRFAAVTHLWGPAQLLVAISVLQPAGTQQAVDRYVDRLAAFPSFLEGLADVGTRGLDEGISAPALVVDRAIGQMERLIAIPPDQSPGMTPVANGTDEGRERVADALRHVLWPAYGRYLEFLRAYRTRARDTIGLLALPDGEERYAVEIVSYTTVPLDAEDVHRIGLEEMESIEQERRRIAEGLGFATADEALAAHAESGADVPSSRDQLIHLAERHVRTGWEGARPVFGRMPSAECEVRMIEEFREGDTPLAYYQPPAGDGSRPGIYWVNTGDLAQRRLHALATVSFHEANPGHHFQFSVEQEHADRPALRRFGGILLGSAFAEGWGLYAERLADELGLYEDDHERLGMLSAQAWRAARLVVDTGIHALGWDRERAVDYLDRATGGPRANTMVEIDRYIGWPGQALSYKIGQREIERFRRDAERLLGPEFDLRDFHDRLLTLGSLPLPALRRELGVGAGSGGDARTATVP
ncbi:MAG TPA: DUF885 domain-containing protein [Actinomycetota bacterium]